MSENTIRFRTIEECSIAIINRFLEAVPQAEKWTIEAQAPAIADFTQRLAHGAIVCIMHDETTVPATIALTQIECSD